MSDDFWNPDRERKPWRRGQKLMDDMFLESRIMEVEVEAEWIWLAMSIEWCCQ